MIYGKLILLAGATVAAGVGLLAVKRAKSGADVAGKPVVFAIKVNRPDLGFTQTHPDPTFEGLRMLGDVHRGGVRGDAGILLRVLRLQNVSCAVERRYNLPENFVLAMAAQESGGADVLPNGKDDGGVGFSHIQPGTAREYGLRIHGSSREMKDFAHGREIRALIEAARCDRRKLIGRDDRFHPVINLDAVGRMLATHMQFSKPRNGRDALQEAVMRYSARSEYWGKVQGFRKLLADKAEIQKVRAAFNKLNPNFKINGERSDFDGYIAECQRQNENYDLAKYQALPRYLPKHAAAMLKKWGKRYD